MSAIVNQWTNSYKRLMFGNEAPGAATWGVSNRSALVRVPTYRLTKEESRRVEIRSIDASMNPYLGYAVLLAAGLRGIREGYELDDPAEDDVHQLTRRERRAMGYKDLPTSLDQALREFEKSEFMAEVPASTYLSSSCAPSGMSGTTIRAKSPPLSCAIT